VLLAPSSAQACVGPLRLWLRLPTRRPPALFLLQRSITSLTPLLAAARNCLPETDWEQRLPSGFLQCSTLRMNQGLRPSRFEVVLLRQQHL